MNQAIVKLTPAVKYLLIINGLVYLAQLVGKGEVETCLALICRWEVAWQIWRSFSYVFLHSSAVGFLFYGLALLLIGSPLEARLGTFKFLLVFLGSVFTGAVAAFCTGALLTAGNDSLVVLGSSAGIFGALAYLVRSEPEAVFNIWLLVLIPIKAAFLWWAAAVGLVVMLLSGAGAVGSLRADLGGFIFGTISIMLLDKVNTLKLEKKIQKRWLAWKRRRKFRKLSCLNGKAIVARDEEAGIEGSSRAELKLLPSQGKENKFKTERGNGDTKLDALMRKLASQGARSLTEEEQKFLASRSQKVSK